MPTDSEQQPAPAPAKNGKGKAPTPKKGGTCKVAILRNGPKVSTEIVEVLDVKKDGERFVVVAEVSGVERELHQGVVGVSSPPFWIAAE